MNWKFQVSGTEKVENKFGFFSVFFISNSIKQCKKPRLIIHHSKLCSAHQIIRNMKVLK